MKKTVYIKLKFYCRLDTSKYPTVAVNYYVVEQLKNAAYISVGAMFPATKEKSFRISDRVTPEEADRLCDIHHYEVTINL